MTAQVAYVARIVVARVLPSPPVRRWVGTNKGVRTLVTRDAPRCPKVRLAGGQSPPNVGGINRCGLGAMSAQARPLSSPSAVMRATRLIGRSGEQRDLHHVVGTTAQRATTAPARTWAQRPKTT
jgi:hypothetical protein